MDIKEKLSKLKNQICLNFQRRCRNFKINERYLGFIRITNKTALPLDDSLMCILNSPEQNKYCLRYIILLATTGIRTGQ